MAGKIIGEVTAYQGGPLPGVRLSAALDGLVRQTQTTGEDGRFTFLGLPDGLYSVRAELEGYSTTEAFPVHVMEGRPVPLTIVLRPE